MQKHGKQRAKRPWIVPSLSVRARTRAAACAYLCVAACLAGCVRDDVAPRPNVLLVVLDTVRRDHLSTYGYERDTTPNLTALAAEGARYDDVLGPAAWTVPSHATLMTGTPPAVHGAHHGHFAISDESTTLAERFRAAGWRTAGFSANPFVGRPTRLDRGFDRFERIDDGGRAVTRAALEFIDAGREPWFVFLNYMEVHMPYSDLPEDVRRRFVRGDPDDSRFLPLVAQSEAHLYACREKQPSQEMLDLLVDLYDAALAHLDEIVGELLAGIEPVRDRTLVVIVSDHGELLGEHGRVEHQWALLEPLLRLPLIVRAPGRIAPGTVVDEPMKLRDVHDLVLSLAGLSPEEEEEAAPGAMHRRPTATAPSDRIAEYHRPVRLLEGIGADDPECAARLDRSLVTVQRGRWKLRWASDGRLRLHDLEADPGETTDVAAAHPEVVDALLLVVDERRRLSRAGRDVSHDPAPELSEAERGRLRALGYLPGAAPIGSEQESESERVTGR